MKSKLSSSASSRICIFCYRDSSSLPSQVDGSKEEGRKGTLDRFVELAQRWLQTDLSLHANDAEEGDKVPFEACEDCLLAVDSFCKLYHEWKCLELEVEWRLTKLCSVIRHADRVTSRKQRLETSFNSSEKGRKFIEHVTKFRKKFKRKCGQHHSKTSPRVVLKRINGRRSCENSTKQEATDNAGEEQKQMIVQNSTQQLCLGWISTFVAVLLLGNWFLEPNGTSHGDCKPILFSPSDSYIVDDDDIDDANDDALSNDGGSSEYFAADQIASISKVTTLSDVLSPRKLQTKTRSTLVLSTAKLPSFQASLSQLHSRKTQRHARIRNNAANSSPFRCFCCSRNFNSFATLLQHRRAFTHILRKKLNHLRKPKLKLQTNFKRRKLHQDSLSSQQQQHYKDELNVGVLRPLKSRRRNVATKSIKQENSSDKESRKSDNENNDKDWDCSNSGDSSETSSSSSCSDVDDDDFKVSSDCSGARAEKQHNKIQKRLKLCRKKPVKLEKKKFACAHATCQISFDFEEELEIHEKHHGNFPCQFCDVVKTYLPDLACHETVHAKTKAKNRRKIYYCARCDFKVSQRLGFVCHYLENHYELPIQRVMCPICKVLITPNSYGYHKKLHDSKKFVSSSGQTYDKRSFSNATTFQVKPKRIYCGASPECHKSFQNKNDLENHQKLHGKFTCSLCPVEATYAPKLALHEATHFSNELETSSVIPVEKSRPVAHSFNCPRCPSIITHRLRYINHFLERHLNLPSERFTCQNCGEKFSVFNGDLAKHMRQKHDTTRMDEQDISRCDQCPAFFSHQNWLFHHKRRMHLDEDSTTCLDCGKKYCTPYALRKHRIIVHKKKEADFLFICDAPGCQRRFERELELGWHKQIMHGSKEQRERIICHECGRSHSSKSNFYAHIKRFHTSNGIPTKKIPKRYVCEECGKVFKAQIILDVHKLFHTGPASWQYECLMCVKRCVSKETLMDHIRSHTNEKPFICEYCGEEYAHGHNLRNHKNKKHNANDIPRKRKWVNGYVSRKGQKLPKRLQLLK